MSDVSLIEYGIDGAKELVVHPERHAQSFSYTAGFLVTKSFTDENSDVWIKTFGNDGTDITAISLWVKQ